MKNAKNFLFILIMCFVFSGCRDNVSAESSSKTESGSIESYNMKMATSVYGPSSLTEMNSGLYNLRYNSSGESNILYIDYPSKKIIYLCDKPNCLHNDETCSSWFSSLCTVFASNQNLKLFVIQSEIIEGGEQTSIWMMEPDGSQREKIYTLPGNEILVDGIIESKDHIYFSTQILQNVKLEPIKQLKKINLKSKAVDKILEYKVNDWIYGVADNRLIILCYENGEYIYKMLSPENGEEKEIYKYTLYSDDGIREQGPISTVEGNYIYILTPLENDVANVIRINAITEEKTFITDSLPFYYRSTTNIIGIYDDIIVVNIISEKDKNEHCYTVDCESGEIKELKNKIQHYELEEFIPIVGSYENYYVIVESYKEIEIMLSGPQGEAYMAKSDIPSYAFIKKQDYWNNKKECIEITSQ